MILRPVVKKWPKWPPITTEISQYNSEYLLYVLAKFLAPFLKSTPGVGTPNYNALDNEKRDVKWVLQDHVLL